jgi:hypothetical protein
MRPPGPSSAGAKAQRVPRIRAINLIQPNASLKMEERAAEVLRVVDKKGLKMSMLHLIPIKIGPQRRKREQTYPTRGGGSNDLYIKILESPNFLPEQFVK